MPKGEPPSRCSALPRFLIGRNSRGNWVVQDQQGLCGGLFVNRTAALKFALFENGNRPQAVIMVPGPLELDMSAKPHAGDQSWPLLGPRLRKPPRPVSRSAHQHISSPTGATMLEPRATPRDERIIEPMIGLARCSPLERIIVMGRDSGALMLELRRRGYVRVATGATCGRPARPYDAALIDWRQRPIKALETKLEWLVGFVAPTGVLVIWADPQSPAANRALRSALEKHGLAVEAGTVCEHGSAVSARRCDMNPISRVA